MAQYQSSLKIFTPAKVSLFHCIMNLFSVKFKQEDQYKLVELQSELELNLFWQISSFIPLHRIQSVIFHARKSFKNL